MTEWQPGDAVGERGVYARFIVDVLDDHSHGCLVCRNDWPIWSSAMRWDASVPEIDEREDIWGV